MSHSLQSHRNNSKCDEGSGAVRSKDSALNWCQGRSHLLRTLPLFKEQGEGDECQGIKKKYYAAMYIPMNGLLQADRQFEFRLYHFLP